MENNNLIAYTESDFDPDTLYSYEDIIPDRMIDIDDVAGELILELKKELNYKGDYEYFEQEGQYYFVPVHHEKAFYDLLKFRIHLLESFQNVLTSKPY
jgi:predicted methyltransferase